MKPNKSSPNDNAKTQSRHLLTFIYRYSALSKNQMRHAQLSCYDVQRVQLACHCSCHVLCVF